MVNQRNVVAIVSLVLEWERDHIDQDHMTIDGAPYQFSVWLASRGALVPSVLTDEECLRINQAGNGAHTFRPPDQRVELEKIAKGEA